MARTVNVTIGLKADPSGPPPPPPPPSTARFAGDPGVGNFYMGVSPNRSTIATHEAKMGASMAMVRSYSTTGDPPWAAADDTIAGGRIPWISWLGQSKTYADIAAGVYDAWIDNTIGAGFAARAPWPIFWTLHHEPENDASASGTNAAAYRAAQRRVKLRMRAAGITNDTFVCCCYMTPFTWNEAASGRDWRTWYPDWRAATGLGTAANPDPNDFYIHGDPNSVVDVIGLDFYHGWDMAAGAPMTNFNSTTGASGWSRYGSRSSFLNKPYAIGEWATAAAQDGTVVDPNHDGSWTLVEYNAQVTAGTITYYPNSTTTWIDGYFANRLNGTVAFCWWDSSLVPATEVANNPLSVADPAETRWTQLGVWGRSTSARKWTTSGAVQA